MPGSERLETIAATLHTTSAVLLQDIFSVESPIPLDGERQQRSTFVVREKAAALDPPGLVAFIATFDEKPDERVIAWLRETAPQFSDGGSVAQWKQLYDARLAYLQGKAVREAPVDEPPDIGDRAVISKPKKKR